MLGAIAGDFIGSTYEASPTKTYDFPLVPDHSRFTDDTVLTVAVAEWILDGGDLVSILHDYFDRYPQAGYGASFAKWAGYRSQEPYGSWGNGSAMRVSPIGFAGDDLDWVRTKARESASVTHNHPEGIKGAEATAGAIWMARQGRDRDAIRDWIGREFGYDLNRTLARIRPSYCFDVSCQGSVPESILCFLESTDFESAIRNAVSLGGDADTMACIAGGMAEAFYGGLPAGVESRIWEELDPPLADMVQRFRMRYG